MIDDGHAVHYTAVERGTPIFSSDEVELGTVEQVVDNYKEHIFDGIVMRTPAGDYRFVDAPEVKRTAERGGDAHDHRRRGRASCRRPSRAASREFEPRGALARSRASSASAGRSVGNNAAYANQLGETDGGRADRSRTAAA